MKVVTEKEFIEWIMVQPDDKPLHLRHPHFKYECLCPMAEYTKQHFPDIKVFDCGFSAAYQTSGPLSAVDGDSRIWQFRGDLEIYRILDIDSEFFSETEPKYDASIFNTYGELKQHIINHGIYTQE